MKLQSNDVCVCVCVHVCVLHHYLHFPQYCDCGSEGQQEFSTIIPIDAHQ